QNITVNAVCPGYVETDMVKGAVANIMKKTGRSEAEARATLIATNPQGRLVEAQEVADTVLWLCRPGAESLTGQCIVLAGGGVGGARADAGRRPAGPSCRQPGGVSPEKVTAVAPSTGPTVALSLTYSSTSRSNFRFPCTTAPGPMTMRGLRVDSVLKNELTGFSTRMPPSTLELPLTSMSPVTVRSPPPTCASLRVM